MLDLKQIREHFKSVKELLQTRGGEFSELDQIIELDEKRREVIIEVEKLKADRNNTSKMIGQYKREGKDVKPILEKVNTSNDKIKDLDEKLKEYDLKIQDLLLHIPNTPYDNVPRGTSEDDNVVIREYGKPTEFDFKAKPHWDLVTELDIIDFERAGKITGSRFAVYKKLGARLERSLISFMLDTHTEKHDYTEVLPPAIVNRDSMTGTGQLPKFEDDAFKLENNHNYFLCPTAEVPITNLHRDEILSIDQLPINYTAYSPCFRAEAGSAGRDTRGIIRQHQFNKVELVKFTKPEDSYNDLEKLTGHAETILKRLELPYRVIELCTGDLGFTSAKTYDIEVWLPSYGEYKEISSCSNFEDYQARRANIKFRRGEKSKPEYVHTLNGSGLAVGRTVAAIIENYQQEDGSIKIPEVLKPYMGGKEYIV
ncbi:serine--tRNA ligase [Haloplasma contractile]|uniref:Serine--tRNA ligase n=1 Tax=Haloplasma contractile SSD-17B TaxID=1033810 RepID=F7PT60_9MOLU|nr:serine--tRNA ligase [Haloplasma contractile]ERJ12525.1 Serine--tRNA ligase protein [Haloplasma contractile SSD-17B]